MSVFSPQLGADPTLTDSQYQANIDSASNLAATQLGLSLSNKSGWTLDQKDSYNHLLATIILTYPDRFTEQEVMSAQYEGTVTYGSLSNEGLWDDTASFVAAVGDNLVSAELKVADIGTGVLNLASGAGQGLSNLGNLSKWIVPVAGITVLAVYLTAFSQRTLPAKRRT